MGIGNIVITALMHFEIIDERKTAMRGGNGDDFLNTGWGWGKTCVPL